MFKSPLSVAAVGLCLLCGSVYAEEQPTLEDQCRAMGVQHGMQGEKLNEWMGRCLEMTKNMHQKHGQKKSPGKPDKHETDEGEDHH